VAARAAGRSRGKANKSVIPLVAVIAVFAAVVLAAAGIGALALSGAFRDEEVAVKEKSDSQKEPEDPKPPEKSDEPSPDAFHVASSQYAKTFDEIEKAIVKLDIPAKSGQGMTCGTGFFIDERGWIATNHHVIKDMTTDARAKMSNGDVYEIAGIIADVPEHDLAIIKLTDKPYQVMLMDIRSYMTEPKFGDEVYSFGHPMLNEFSLTKGIVSRVVTTADIQRNHPTHLLAKINAPRDLVWIQHQAKISPGNSGGPLFIEGGKVIGVNSFVHQVADFGFACHVRFLRELADRSTDTPSPLPRGRGPAAEDPAEPVADLSSEQMQELFDACKQFAWNPSEAQQYQKMAQLAGAMATANGKQDETATTLFGQLRGVSFNDSQINAINGHAVGQLEQVGQGILLFATVQQAAENALLMKVTGKKEFILVMNLPPQASEASQGQKFLIVGLISPQAAQLAPSGTAARYVNTRHMARID